MLLLLDLATLLFPGVFFCFILFYFFLSVLLAIIIIIGWQGRKERKKNHPPQKRIARRRKKPIRVLRLICSKFLTGEHPIHCGQNTTVHLGQPSFNRRADDAGVQQTARFASRREITLTRQYLQFEARRASIVRSPRVIISTTRRLSHRRPARPRPGTI